MEKLVERQKVLSAQVSDLIGRAGDVAEEIDGLYEGAEDAKKEYYRLIDEGERQRANEKLDSIKPLRKKAAVLVQELRKLKEPFRRIQDEAELLCNEAVGYAKSEEEIFKKAEKHFEAVRITKINIQNLSASFGVKEKGLAALVARFDG